MVRARGSCFGSLVSAKVRPLVRLPLSESSSFQKTSLERKKIILARRAGVVLEQALQLRREGLTPYYAPPPLSVALRGVHTLQVHTLVLLNLRISTRTIAMVRTVDAMYTIPAVAVQQLA